LVEKKLLSVMEAARILGFGRSHTYRYVMLGEIESLKFGKSRKIPKEALDAFIEKRRQESATET